MKTSASISSILFSLTVLALAGYAGQSVAEAKTYYGGGTWYTLDHDYERIAEIMQDAGFKGWVSLEFEGKESADAAVPASLARLRSAFS